METDGLVIYGGGGFAREVAWLAESLDTPRRVLCFADDAAPKGGGSLGGVPVLGLDAAAERFAGTEYVCAVGAPATRSQMTGRAERAGFIPATLVHPTVQMGSVRIGRGAIICAGSVLTVDIEIGEHVHINLNCTIGHDVRIGRSSTLAPGVHVSGCVEIGDRVSIGTGATIINGTTDAPLVIGDDAVIGAAACVVGNLEGSRTYVGVPAREVTPSGA